MEAVNNQLTVIDKSIEVFRGGSAILISHQNRSSKALAVAGDILRQWEVADSIQDPAERMDAYAAVDQRSNKFLANCGVAVTEMQESRKAITQLMDMIKKMFTEEENKLDVKKGGLPGDIQERRNKYAKDLFAEQERQRKVAEIKAAKAREEVELRAWLKNMIATCLLDYLANRKSTIINSFNSINLGEFEEKSQRLHKMSTEFPQDKLNDILVRADIFQCEVRIIKHSSVGDLEVIQTSERNSYDFNGFFSEYTRHISELKSSLIDQLPSKLQELQEQKRLAEEAERKRQEELERQRVAEEERQRQLALSKNEEERKRREQEAEAARKSEAERLAAMEREAEEQRLAAQREQKQREEAEARRQLEEAERLKKEAEDRAELEKAAGTAGVLFDMVSEASVVAPSPETRVGYDITVLHPAGWVELFQFWFQREGCKMKVEDMGKKSLNQMKTYAEGIAKKEDAKIESKFLRYETSVKSVNRKAVTA